MSTEQASTPDKGLKGKMMDFVSERINLDTIENVLKMSDNLTQATARLNLMNDGIQTTEELQNMIFASAERSRGAYQATADVVTSLGKQVGDVFSSNRETIAFAENLNKSFVIAGASQQEIASVSQRLTEAMGSGVLGSQEMNEVFQSAPNIIQTIADHMKLPIGSIQEMASSGTLTAEIVKEAMLGATDEINAKFEAMPMTYGQIFTSIKNNALMAFKSIFIGINDMVNSEVFQALLNGVKNSMGLISGFLLGVFNVMGELANIIFDHWAIISPAIFGVVAALGIYGSYLAYTKGLELAIKGIKVVSAIASYLLAIATGKVTEATLAQTAATLGLNAALLASPITQIILGIIMLIAVIYMVIGAINKFTDASLSATGIIIGAFAVLGAFIWNTLVGVINGIIQYIWAKFVTPFISIIEWILNIVNGGFDNLGDAVANLIGNIISWFLSLGKVVTKIIDTIFGTDWTSGLESLQDKVLRWGKNENAITLDRDAPQVLNRIEYKNAWDAGYSLGEGIEDKVSGLFAMPEIPGIPGEYDEVMTNLERINENTGGMKHSLSMSEEDLKFLRDIAEVETVNRFTTAEIKVEMPVNATVNHEMDLDGVIDYLGQGVNQAMEVAAEGAHL